MKTRKHSALYRHIEHLQGDRPWGTLLDAGTGDNSIRWVSDLLTERWTAVTGSAGEADLVSNAVGAARRPEDRIVLGNWADEQLLKGEVYDTVLADYLLGAVEGFAPYFQPYLFKRLRPLTGRALYITCLEPYVPTTRPKSQAGRLLWEIGRFRDACVLMKGRMPYREYPAPWAADHIKRAGFEVREIKHFNIAYKDKFIDAQINIALNGIEALSDQALVDALKDRGEALRKEALAVVTSEGALRHCRNYVIAAEPC
ncbi:MAG: class I SAM-dependent methyltransferase [Pseudomonadota bacterium]